MSEQLHKQEPLSSRNWRRFGRGVGALTLAGLSLYGLAGCDKPVKAKGACVNIDQGSSRWPLHGSGKTAYVEVTKNQVHKFMGSNPDSVDFTKMPNGYENKVLINPADKNNDDYRTTIQKGIWHETVAINDIDSTSVIADSNIPKGTMHVEFFKGDCGFNVSPQ